MDFGTIINILFFAFVIGSIVAKAVKAAKKAKADRKGIPVVSLEGGFATSSDPNSTFRRLMDDLAKIEALKPKVMVLKVNSPGSTVGAAYEVYTKLNELRTSGTKVVALMQDVAASGGVYVSMASDYVVAGPSTLTGSIGVIMQGYDLSELLPEFKIKTRVIKSGEMKDIGSQTRPMTEAETEVLRSMIIDDWQQFCHVVAAGRKMDVNKVAAFSDGRVFNGRYAHYLGLVDELGGLSAALKAAGRLAEMPEADCKPVIFEKKMDFAMNLRKLLPGTRLEERLTALVPDSAFQGVPLYMMQR